MTGPSVGLSGKSKPIVNLNSPVKNTLQLIDTFATLRLQAPTIQATSESSSPAPQDAPLPSVSAPSPSSLAINSLIDGFQDTRAAFLFDGSPPSSTNAIPTIEFAIPDEPKLSGASTYPMPEWQLGTLTKGALVEQILKLQHDVGLLMDYSESVTLITCPMGAQLTLMALENQNLRSGLRLKEKKNSQRNVLFADGRGKETTGDVFFELRKELDAHVAASKADAEKRKADRAVRKAIWAVQKEEHDKKKTMFATQGLPMSRAGPPPLLRDILLPGETRGSAEGSTTAKNIQKGKGRRRRDSIDSLPGEDFDLDELLSDEESGIWSAHDESDA